MSAQWFGVLETWPGLGAEKDWDRAVADYSEAIRLEPQNMSYYRARSNAWFGKGDQDKAIRDIDEAIPLKPQEVDLLYTELITGRRSGTLRRPWPVSRRFFSLIRSIPRPTRCAVNSA